MARITVHIGAGKCGSTAIQRLMTRHPVIRTRDGEATYVVADWKGRVLSGRQVRFGRKGDSRMTAKHRQLLALSEDRFARIRLVLRQGPHAVMSNEHYLNAADDARSFLARLALPVEVVAYVRPQVDYLNSAWWQWDAWEGLTRIEWIEKRLGRSNWHRHLDRWRAIPEVERLVVRPLPEDVVTDFLEVLGAEPSAVPPQPRPNQSLPGPLLRFLQARPDLHERFSRELTWTLPRLLGGRLREATPWVVDVDLVEHTIRKLRPDNERLLDLMEPEAAGHMRADQRWWDPAAYADRQAEPLVLSPGEGAAGSEALAAALLEALLEPSPRRQQAARTSWRGSGLGRRLARLLGRAD